MNIQTQFNINDTVYVQKGSRIDKKVVRKIRVIAEDVGTEVHYFFFFDNAEHLEEDLFSSPQSLVEHLRTEHERRLAALLKTVELDEPETDTQTTDHP